MALWHVMTPVKEQTQTLFTGCQRMTGPLVPSHFAQQPQGCWLRPPLISRYISQLIFGRIVCLVSPIKGKICCSLTDSLVAPPFCTSASGLLATASTDKQVKQSAACCLGCLLLRLFLGPDSTIICTCVMPSLLHHPFTVNSSLGTGVLDTSFVLRP